jgi:diacylglycerol kinase (ATP)
LKKKILFIVNPIAGGRSKERFPDWVDKYLNKDVYNAEVAFTSHAHHAFKLAMAAVTDYEIIVAVGGDGTINEVATALIGKPNILGIIPQGSGNGLARFLGIPINIRDAILNLNHFNVHQIDAAKVNDRYFFNIAGMGFDAHISEKFASGQRRGFNSYIQAAIREILSYKAENYNLIIDGNKYHRKAFMLSFANSSQYGNNAYISPEASANDGLIDVCIIKPFPIYKFPILGLRLFTKTAQRSPYVEIIRGKAITVIRNDEGAVHADGEPLRMGKLINVKILPGVLNVLIGKK